MLRAREVQPHQVRAIGALRGPRPLIGVVREVAHVVADNRRPEPGGVVADLKRHQEPAGRPFGERQTPLAPPDDAGDLPGSPPFSLRGAEAHLPDGHSLVTLLRHAPSLLRSATSSQARDDRRA
ncbi:hypothetical protein [Methanoculleus chikugoensis]|uniref:hypothetical protein n=1 Tax=Methanoculleus chikugoensis TaxID=118126 RepID=UPI001FB36907|nr:hypothetical protein [Methanoculleus chikugoensis]